MKKIHQLLGTPLSGQNITALPGIGHLDLFGFIVCRLLDSSDNLFCFHLYQAKNICALPRAQQSWKSQFYSTQIGGILLRIEHPRLHGPAGIVLRVQARQMQHRQLSKVGLMDGQGRVRGEEGPGLLAFATTLLLVPAVAEVCPFALKASFLLW